MPLGIASAVIIYGIALNGENNTRAISDTDAGMHDNDEVWDRGVGPMQFIPSTWSVVGVDADGDAKRNPQDIDDAALAAVCLCSGTDNLSTEAGQRTSVFRYNHSDEYVDLVLSIMNAYLQGDYTSVPNHISSTVTFTPSFAGTRATSVSGTKHTSGATAAGTSGTPQPQAEEPAAPATDPVRQVQETVRTTTAVVTTLLTVPQAILTCTSLGYNALLTRVAWNACSAGHTTAP